MYNLLILVFLCYICIYSYYKYKYIYLTFTLVCFLFNTFRMRYVAAYLLASLGGNASPSEADISAILSSVGIESDATKLSKVLFSVFLVFINYKNCLISFFTTSLLKPIV